MRTGLDRISFVGYLIGMANEERQDGLADQLRAAIAESGLTRAEIARRTGLSYSIVHAFVAGPRDITVGTVERLCRALDMNVWLVRRKAKRKA